MAKDLTPEETAELLENPNVLSVINGKVRFTKEFKELAYQGLENGTPMRQIFEENGIDPEILGMGRIYIFTYRIRKNAERSQGHTDLRVHNRHKPAKIAKGQTLESKVNQLEHELAYTQQEVEFLKKIHLADLEAREQWESKHHQK